MNVKRTLMIAGIALAAVAVAVRVEPAKKIVFGG